MRILIFLEVSLELWKGQARVGIGEGGTRILGDKFVDDFGKQLMCNKGRIVGITDYDSGDTFGTAIGMECVGWNGTSAKIQIGREMAMRPLVGLSGQYISLQRLASDRALFVLQLSC